MSSSTLNPAGLGLLLLSLLAAACGGDEAAPQETAGGALPANATLDASESPPPVPTDISPLADPEPEVFRSHTGAFEVSWYATPGEIPMNADFDVHFRLRDPATGDDLDVPLEAVAIDARMPHHRHGMNQRPELTRDETGLYSARGLLMHMIGRWEIYFDVRLGATTERAQTFIRL